MHRINLRGPWSLQQRSNEAGQPSVTLTRNFNSPTNIDSAGVSVILSLSVCMPPNEIGLNRHCFPISSSMLADAVRVLEYDVKSALLPHNKLSIRWQDQLLNLDSNPLSVRLQTEQTNRWLIDAWLEIVES